MRAFPLTLSGHELIITHSENEAMGYSSLGDSADYLPCHTLMVQSLSGYFLGMPSEHSYYYGLLV